MKVSLRPINMLAAVGVLAALAHAGDYSTWSSYRPVTLSTSGMGLSAAVADYPISVRFKASAHEDMLNNEATQAQEDGSDIRVTLADGTTDVPFEIEHISVGDSNGVLHMWILADNVPADNPSAASFRVYWGKEGETSMSDPEATFPTSAGFQAVFHMNDTGSTITNAANSDLNGEATGTSTTTGQVAAQGYVSAKSGARVRTFGTSNDGISDGTPTEDFIQFTPDAGHILSTHSGPITMEGWIYSSIGNSGNTSAGTKTVIAHGDGNTGGKAWFARAADTGDNPQNHYHAGGPNYGAKGPAAPWGEQHHWQFVTAVWDGTNYFIYRQREKDPWNNHDIPGPTGMLPDSVKYKVIPGTAPEASTMPWYIGGASADSVDGVDTLVTRGWQGWMDEVRISTVARDSNYVKLQFLTTRADTLAGVIHPISIGGTETPGSVGNYGDWAGHRSIILNTSETGADVAGDVENFPVLVRLGRGETSILAAAKPDGSDIRFSKADNTTALPYEIESWSSTSAAIWVLVDEIEGDNATQTIRMHWGNPAANDESDGTAVFDTANGFVSVWHMNGATTETSSTEHEFEATPFGVPGVDEESVIGSGRTFNGTQHMQVVGSADSEMNFAADEAYTFSAWVRSDSVVPTGDNTGHAVVTKGDYQWALAIFGGTGPNRHYEVTTHVGNWQWHQTTTAAVDTTYAGDYANDHIGEWRHMVGTWDGDPLTAATGRIYLDGVLQKETVFNITAPVDQQVQTARDVHIGVLSNHGADNTEATGELQRFFIGALDEITVSRGVRSADWVKLAYENQKIVNSLLSIGQPVYTAPDAPTNVIATADTASAIISWTAPAEDGGLPISEYKAMVVGDTLIACTSTTLTCTITGLSAAAPLNVVVRASNEAGPGPNSSASNAVTPISPVVPTAPQGVTAITSGSSTIAVGWSAPAYNGGATITGYTVTGVPGGTCTTTEMFCVVTGLTQGTAYKFTVVATNSIGSGEASDTATATTTGILPNAFVIHMDGARNPYTYRIPAASVDATEKLSMIISDVQGKRIWSRTITPASSKVRELTWDGTTSKGRAVAPGLYVVRIKAEVGGASLEAIRTGIKQ